MNTIEETIEVAVPVRTAYNQWTQFKSFPRFMSAVKRVEQIRPAITHWVIRYGPVRYALQAEIVHQRPDSSVVWRCLQRRPPTGVRCRSAPRHRTAPRSPCA
ncbi:hypothetical protein SSPO_008820 [Streptomyces antimycoticus]|uniref:Coenzyme Q-binding protein COQ10 START domain-containing protein n=1 Tax=Streptomyces antimycoticus TaxID=68175 RepID=A0A499UBG6_9ACTN|nr:hypothetical protein SSPO_008820 [Streptomyces antimycoticus]